MVVGKDFFRYTVVAAFIYLIADLFLDQFMLYLTGGIIGGTIKEIGKLLNISFTHWWIIIIWVLFLIGLVFMYQKVKHRILDYTLLLIIAFFLYLIDFMVYKFLPYDITTFFIRVITSCLIAFIKGITLSSIIQMKRKVPSN